VGGLITHSAGSVTTQKNSIQMCNCFRTIQVHVHLIVKTGHARFAIHYTVLIAWTTKLDLRCVK
jgi:hypothetical protein